MSEAAALRDILARNPKSFRFAGANILIGTRRDVVMIAVRLTAPAHPLDMAMLTLMARTDRSRHQRSQPWENRSPPDATKESASRNRSVRRFRSRRRIGNTGRR